MKNPIRPCRKGIDRPAKTARAALVPSGKRKARRAAPVPSVKRKARRRAAPVRLTEKQRKFVESYMGGANGNATQAARLAGYAGNDNTLASMGDANMRKAAILAAIEERVKQDPAVADRESRQRFWTAVMGDSVAEMRDRLRASELLGRSQADFVTRVEAELTVPLRQTITIGRQIIEF